MQCARLGLEGSLAISIPAVHAPTAPSVAEASKGPFSARHVALATVQPTLPLQGQKTVYPVRDYLRINDRQRVNMQWPLLGQIHSFHAVAATYTTMCFDCVHIETVLTQ